MPYPLPLTRTEAYLAYKAGAIQQSDLKPSLAVPRNGIDAWLAYWTGLAEDYPKREDGTPHILQEEEAYIAYLCGVTNEYPEKCLRRVGAYLRYLISARWGRPDHPLNREELYLSLIKTQFIPSGDPSSDIVIDGTAKAPFVDVKMYGDTFQQTYTGKNLANPTPVSGGSNGVFATYNSQTGEVTVSGTAQTTWSNLFKVVDASYLTAGTYTLKQYGELTNGRLTCYARGSGHQVNASTLQTTFTTTSDGNAYICITGLTSGSPVSGTIKFQLESGSTATEFEPFVNGQPSPSPEYPQQIQTVTGEQTVTIVGKNLFNAETETSVFIDSSGNIIPGSTWSCSDYIKVSPNTTYVWHGEQTGTLGGQVIWAGYDSSQAFISGQYAQINNTTSTSFTTGNTTEYIRVGYRNDRLGSMQLELGSTASSYAPYSKHTYPINLGKNLFDKNNATISHFYPHVSEIRQNDSAVSIVLPVEAGTTYTASTTNRSLIDSTPAVACTDHLVTSAPDSFLSRTSWGSGDSVSFTAPAGAKYMYLYVKWTTDATTIANVLATIQIEKGSQATTYAPYFTPIELCKLGTYQDYIWKDGSDWKVHKAIGSMLFSEAGFSAGQIGTTGHYRMTSLAVQSTAVLPPDNSTVGIILSNAFVSKTVNNTYNRIQGIALQATGTTKGAVYIYADDYDENTASNFNAKMAQIGAKFYYALLNPTDTTITDQTLIAQLDSLVNGGAEDGTTYIKVNATDPNLPGLLYVEAPKYE